MNTIETSFPEFRLKKSSGLHTYLYHYACSCAEEEIDPAEAICHMTECVGSLSYHRDVPEREIRSAVEDAYSRVIGGQPRNTRALPRYERDSAMDIYESYQITREDLISDSPVPPPDAPAEALAHLFIPDELVCVAKEFKSARTLPLSVWLELDEDLRKYQFVVPHPMTSKKGETKDGRMSSRTFSNTGKRRRIVCDFDEPKAEMQPSLIVHLSKYCGEDPELILTSGGKSLHAWWRIDDWPDEYIERFEDEAARVGADPALLGEARKCQPVRLPAGTRNNGKSQSILFWNPSPIE
jgi:hypothetical protein